MKRQGLANVMAGAVIALALTVTAHAQNNRSFVATTGNDTNNCTSAAYCRTFARALAVTNSGGEVVVVNSGGYGPFTITQPVTITAIGIAASITQTTAGQNAITINTTGNVTITGLNLNGGGTGNDGILLENGVLRLYGMQIQNFAQNGIEVYSPGIGGYSGVLSIYDSKVSGNGNSGLFTGSPTYVHNTAFDRNRDGGAVSTGGFLAIADSSAQYNSSGFVADGGTIVLDNDSSTLNTYGLTAMSGGKLYFAHCVVSGNTYAYTVDSSSTLAGSNPGTSLIAPGQATGGALSTATALK